jgi:hypothetical protein
MNDDDDDDEQQDRCDADGLVDNLDQTLAWRPREQPFAPAAGTSSPPPPISLQKQGRFQVFLEDVSEAAERRQLPLNERVSPRSRAPSISSRSRYVRVRLPPPPFDSPFSSPSGEPKGSLMASHRQGECLSEPRDAGRVEGRQFAHSQSPNVLNGLDRRWQRRRLDVVRLYSALRGQLPSISARRKILIADF